MVISERCSGHGRCWMLSPRIYTATEDGHNSAAGSVINVPPSGEREARVGVDSCPEGALVVIEE